MPRDVSVIWEQSLVVLSANSLSIISKLHSGGKKEDSKISNCIDLLDATMS